MAAARYPKEAGAYAGNVGYKSSQAASLIDLIPIGGLSADVTAAKVTSIETELRWYRYQ